MTLLYVKNPSEGEQEIALLLPEATYHFSEARPLSKKWYWYDQVFNLETPGSAFTRLINKELTRW